MAPKPLVLTLHALDAAQEREIDRDWIERTALEPEWTAPDPRRHGVEQRFRSIPENGGRILRVACFETSAELRILTAFFGRDARRRNDPDDQIPA